MSWLPDWLTGYDSENAARAAEADAKLRALNERQATAYGEQWKAQVDRNYATQEAIGEDAQRRQIDEAFDEGWAEGRDNVSRGIKGTLNLLVEPLRAVLAGIPWWLWLLALGFLAFKLGLLNGIFRKVKAATA